MTTKATVKERPILFSGPMVRAILDGRKTQTRRVMKRQPATDDFADYRTDLGYPASEGKLWAGFWGDPKTKQVNKESGGEMGSPLYYDCPYGTKGDRLWVRETWRVRGGREYEYQRHQPSVVYRVTADVADQVCGEWRPSIFMPRWASRLTLEITGIRVQRVKDIRHEDAVAEGCYRIEPCAAYPNGNAWGRAGFAALWDSINKPRGFGWDVNPWVWVVEFRKVTGGSDERTETK